MMRYLILGVFLVLAWKGITRFVLYWAEMESRRMQVKHAETRGYVFRDDGELSLRRPPRASGCGRDRKRVG